MLLNYNIYQGKLNTIKISDSRIINTINPHSYCIAKKDTKFNEALKSSDLLLPDGIGIVWASKFLQSKKIKKIAGYDIFIHLLELLNLSKGSCFFLGASKNTLELIKARIHKEYPNIKVNTYSPPYKSKFSEDDNKIMREKVNTSNADILFVGMTAPKQEKWVHQNNTFLNVKTICSIGAVFDFYAGTVERSGAIWIKLGLEWLPRFLKEPKRLAERNLVSSPKFVIEVLSYKFRKKGIL